MRAFLNRRSMAASRYVGPSLFHHFLPFPCECAGQREPCQLVGCQFFSFRCDQVSLDKRETLPVVCKGLIRDVIVHSVIRSNTSGLSLFLSPVNFLWIHYCRWSRFFPP